MVLAGGLLGLNVTERPESVSMFGHDITYYGWPTDARKVDYGLEYISIPGGRVRVSDSECIETGIVANIAVALSILFAVWFMLELRINRQEARRTEDIGTGVGRAAGGGDEEKKRKQE